MPNLKLFKRRSSGNVLDIAPEPEPSGQSSFRVLERPDRAQHTFDGPAQKRLSQAGRPLNSPLQNLRGRSEDNLGFGLNRSVERTAALGPDWALKGARGSGGTTNSGSSGYYDSSNASARHSSSSTLPSSVDQDREAENEELFPRKSATTPMYQSIAEDAPLPPPPSFTARAARALSFGQNKHNRSNSIPNAEPSLPPAPYHSAPRSPDRARQSPLRDRSMTSSSYASTAKPAKQEQDFSLGTTNFGDDFGNMFDGIGKKSREDLPLPSPPVGSFHRTVRTQTRDGRHGIDSDQESEPMYPPRTLSRQAFTPSPNMMRNARDDAGSPYSFDGRGSVDGLMPGSALSSPKLFDDAPPPPAHAFLGGRSKAGYSLVPERNRSPSVERTSSDSQGSQSGFYSDDAKEQGYGTRQTHLDDGDRWTQKVELRDSQHQSLSNAPSQQS